MGAINDQDGNTAQVTNEGALVTTEALGDGVWGYTSGVSGTVTLGANQYLAALSAYSPAGGTVSINGGSNIPIPAGLGISMTPKGAVKGAVLVFTGTSTYVVETIT